MEEALEEVGINKVDINAVKTIYGENQALVKIGNQTLQSFDLSFFKFTMWF